MTHGFFQGNKRGLTAVIGLWLMLSACSGGGGATPTALTVIDDSRLFVGGNGSNALLGYNSANRVSASAAVDRIVTGASTRLIAPRAIAVDMPRNQIYVANTGGNSILVFDNARTVTGNLAPNRTLSNTAAPISPEAVFLDSVQNRLYVTSGNSVLIYDHASALSGDGVSPSRSLSGGATTLASPTGIFVDATRDLLYVANGTNRILVFTGAANANGAAAPARSIPIFGNAAGLFVDVMADRLYVADTSTNSVLIFDGASTAGSLSTPSRTLAGGGSRLNQPSAVFVDTGADRLYVANAGDDSILVFNGANSISNSATPGRILNLPNAARPYGVFVDVTPLVIGSTANLDGFARSDGTASSSGAPAMGDKDLTYSFGVGWRQIYSFDIASIPGSSTITSATLRLYQCDVQGAPYTLLGNIVADHVNYGGAFDPFGGAYNVSPIDFVGTLSTTTGLGYRALAVTNSVRKDLSASNTRSQYRLRFSLRDSSFDGNDDFVQFTDAEDSLCAGKTTNRPPQLTITMKP